MVVTSEDNNIKRLLSGWGLSLTGRPCDTCRTASALLYCSVDAAFLCGACDATIHHNTRHERVWVCDVCEQAPASVACEADAASLCAACDHDIHSANPLAHRHRRIPITPFVDSPVNNITSRPTPAPASSFLVPDDFDTTVPIQPPTTTLDDDDVDTWLIPNPNSTTFLYNDSDLLNFGYNCGKQPPQFQDFDIKPNVGHSHSHSQTTQTHNSNSYTFTDSVVPTHSNGNITNNSLHHNSFSNPSEASSLFENCFNIDFTQPNKLQKKNHDFFSSSSSFNYSNQHSVSSSDIGVVPDNGNANSMSEVSYTFSRSTAVIEGEGGGGSTAMDREARVLRYREKRKNRKFQKTIRYASRKAYAETRPRIKGRFAKRSENNGTADLDFVVDGGYGVVPAF